MNPSDTERRALALYERLADRPGNTRLRARLTRNQPDAVIARLSSLEASAKRARNAIPTLIPGSADADDAALPPARVGAFRLVERIGRGGMGDVWLGERDDGLYEQKVAIKLIQRHALSRAAAAFDDERRFLARLDHPNIVRLIDGGVTEDELPWLAMEYFEGEPIDAACSGRTLTERAAMFVKAADAVQFAHGKMIAHADLKPGNILVGDNDRVRLLDFGISGLIGGDARSFTGSGPLTREFASPQRLAGAPPSVADDVFALGKTLKLLVADRDADLAAIAAKASHPEEQDRYGSVAALIADLDRWRARLPVSAVPARMQYRARKFVERHRKGVMATGMAMVVLATTSLVATNNYVRAERTRVAAEKRFGEVRHLSRFMLFDLYDDLARRPGTVAKRAEIARTSAEYLERLRVSADAPADLRLDTARSYRRLAAIQGLPAVSNLGEPEAAAASLEKADGLLAQYLKDRPADVTALTERGWVAAERWALAPDDAKAPRGNAIAQSHFDAALRRDPANAAARLGLIMVARNRGYDLIWGANQPARADPILQTALRQLRTTRWTGDLAGVARKLEIDLLNRIGDATYYAGNIPGALTPYREADALIDAMIAVEGATPQLIIAKGEQAFNIGGTLSDIGGRDGEALAVVKTGVERLETLLAAGPDSAAEKWLLVLYGQEALTLESIGRLRDALDVSSSGIALREARLVAVPGNPQRLRDVAVGLMPHAELLAKAGRPTEACAAATRADTVWRDVRRRRNMSAFDASRNLPRAEALKKNLCRD